MAINEVRIPVSLQLESVGKQVADLRKLVQNGVNVDSSSYKRLNELLGQAERGLINMGQSAKKSFTSMGEVHKFENGIDKIYDKTGAVIDILKNLTFKDLKFSNEELAPIENLKNQLTEIDKQIKNINSKDFKLDKLTTEELTKNGIKVAGKDTKAIQSDIGKAKKQAEAELSKYQELERKLNEITLKPKFNKEDRNILMTQLGLTEDDLKDVDKVLQAAIAKVEELPKEISLKKEKINTLDSLGNEIEKTAQEQLGMMPELEAKRNALVESIRREKEALAQAAKESMALAVAQDSLKKEYQEMKTTIAASEAELQKLVSIQNKLNNVQSAVKRWFGLNEVLNLTKRTVRNVVTHIRELDDTMTEIAIVTDMTQEQLWDQVSTYSALAREYGATIKGVYEVSQLYYQQGLQTNEVMNLTEETLKMARLSNVSYKDSTDYMTVALRGFKLEMSEAQRVVDVYARIAAVSASDTKELAEAMSKTASSAEAVGASFENTTAMIALMVETTR